MRKILPLALVLGSFCDNAALASEHEPVTTQDVLGFMAAVPPEGCLYSGKSCKPAGYDKGPDALRIAQAIAATASGEILGNARDDAALMAVFSSYESGNDTRAEGDHHSSHGAFQIKFVPQDVAEDPVRAAPIWRSLALLGMSACAKNDPDERLASVAGSCSATKAKTKVRQRVQLARTLTRQ
jgi:hypothetical protein